jgi:eukaryotic-like serine/threonine-protein kinase
VSTRLIDPSSDVVQRIGRYDLVAEIASGGMATVYLARLSGVGGFQRNVAIKCLHPHLARNLEFVEMFLDEARLAALIHHPNVVPIQEVEERDQGYYLVMDYIEGDTFASLLSRSASLGRQVPLEIALRVLIDTLVGLDAAHELRDARGAVVGLVHRDVSPQNILVGTDGVARITDFGVARAASRLSATRAGQLKGKLAYMAPEQAGGEEEVDRRADVFSAGVVLWEALAFRRLFKASNEAATLTRVLTEPIVSPAEINPSVPEAIARVCMKALERDLNRRYVSCAEFADALERAAVEARALATTREVAAFVLEVVGDDVESHRRAIRQWLDRHERSQAGLALGPRDRPTPSSPSAPGQDPFPTREGSAVTLGDRPSTVGRLPVNNPGLGSHRPPGDAFSEFSSAWPGTMPSMPPALPPPRGGGTGIAPPSVVSLPPPRRASPSNALSTASGLGVPTPPPSSGPFSGGGMQGRSAAAALLEMVPPGSEAGLSQAPGLPGLSSATFGSPSSSSPPGFGAGLVGMGSGTGPHGFTTPSAPDSAAAPERGGRRGWLLAGVTCGVLLLSFGVTWLVTDASPATDSKETLPLRSNVAINAAGPAREEVALPTAPAVSTQSEVRPASAASVPAPAAALPAASAPAAVVQGSDAVEPSRVVRTPIAPRKPRPTSGSKPSRGAAPDLENPYQ